MSQQSFYDQIPQVMRVTDFAEFFKFDLSTVHRMCTSGELGCQRRKGASIRIMKFHITEWMEKCEQTESNSSKSTDATTGMSGSQGKTVPKGQTLSRLQRRMKTKLKSI